MREKNQQIRQLRNIILNPDKNVFERELLALNELNNILQARHELCLESGKITIEYGETTADDVVVDYDEQQQQFILNNIRVNAARMEAVRAKCGLQQ
jgi:hypothetical protein